MTEWMSKLERAKRLLDAGALTPEEYEIEKARLLPRPEAGTSSEPEGATLWERGGHRLIAIALVAMLLGAFVFFAWSPPSTRSTKQEATPEADQAEPPQNVEEKVGTSAVEREPPLPELAAALPLRSWSRCEFEEPFRSLFARFDNQDTLRTDVESVSIPQVGHVKADVTRSPADMDSPEGPHEVTISLPIQGTWDGLRLSRIVLYDLEDAGYMYRQIRFLETPETVRSVLTRNDIPVPIPGEWKAVDAGEMWYFGLEAVPGGAALTCSYD